MLPRLQSLAEEACGLSKQVRDNSRIGSSSIESRTVFGSVSGTASSLAMLDMVSCLGGAAWVAILGAAGWTAGGTADFSTGISADFRLSLRRLVNLFILNEY